MFKHNQAAQGSEAGHQPAETIMGRRRAQEFRSLRQIQRRLDNASRLELIDAYRAGERRRNLATRFGIHPTTVDVILADARVPPRPRRGRTVEEVNQTVDLYERQRVSCAQIGTRLGCDAKTIWRALRGRGVLVRDSAGSDR